MWPIHLFVMLCVALLTVQLLVYTLHGDASLLLLNLPLCFARFGHPLEESAHGVYTLQYPA
jgi:hypothetical protein